MKIFKKNLDYIILYGSWDFYRTFSKFNTLKNMYLEICFLCEWLGIHLFIVFSLVEMPKKRHLSGFKIGCAATQNKNKIIIVQATNGQWNMYVIHTLCIHTNLKIYCVCFCNDCCSYVLVTTRTVVIIKLKYNVWRNRFLKI